MKTIKLWIIAAFSLTFLLLTTIFILMGWSDTYSNTHYQRTNFYTEPNKNVLKVHYILQNKHKYDSFIFGSSRVGSLNPLKIQNGYYYNMTYSEGLPKEHLLNIQLFLNKDIHIKNLLIGLDEFSYQVSFEKHQHQGLTKAYYAATKTNKFTYYRELYLRFPLGEDRHHLAKKIMHKPTILTLDVSQQLKKYKYLQEHFKADNYNTIQHLQNSRFLEPTYYNGNFLASTLSSLQELKNICSQNNINCKFFINPIHQKTYEYTNKKLLSRFKQELAKITDFYDFSKQTEISKNNRYWLDTSHYTLEIGDLILKTIFNNKVYVKNFGVHVKKQEKN